MRFRKPIRKRSRRYFSRFLDWNVLAETSRFLTARSDPARDLSRLNGAWIPSIADEVETVT